MEHPIEIAILTIMKTKYILSIAILALSLGACTNYFDEKVMNDGSIPAVTDVRTGMVYELTDDDYKQIATYPENIEKALALDPVDSTGLAELQKLHLDMLLVFCTTLGFIINLLHTHKILV